MKVLIIDDEQAIRALIRSALTNLGYEIWDTADGESALEVAASQQFDLIFCDVGLQGMNGFEVLKALRNDLKSDAEIILITGAASAAAAVEAIDDGANDYICKPISLNALERIARGVRERRYPNNIVRIPRVKLSGHEILGSSPTMIEVVKNASRVASTNLPVMISGESGTGKELIASLIHRKSGRADKPFVTLNCAALPDTLLEAELFGHTRGAFTGALTTRRGLFEQADGGTLLLDEVTETSPAFQVKLLRALQEGEIRLLGSNTKKRVDVRIISTTNRNVTTLDGASFRTDLLYRLQGATIHLSPLRERVADIRPMALAFLSQFNPENNSLAITTEALLALEKYNWAGNVRELKHLMTRLAALYRDVIRLEDLPAEISKPAQVSPKLHSITANEALPTLAHVELNYLKVVLDAVKGNKTQAANVMGVDRKTLYRMVERLASTHAN
jgi:two-component system, NtrC family, response regulator AtoC